MKIGDIVYSANTSAKGIEIGEFKIIGEGSQKMSFIGVSVTNSDIRQVIRVSPARHPTHHKCTQREAVEALKKEVAEYMEDADRRLQEVETEVEELTAEQQQIDKWLSENP